MRTFVIGSKNLSVGVLRCLVDQGHEVLGVITRDLQPEMKVWHEQIGHKSLHEEAEKLQIPVHEGINVNSEICKELLRALKLEVIFSCFWGQIIRQDVLDIPRLGIFNLHTAYLPFNRGSRPIPWSLIRGQKFTGLTIHRMHAGVDNGPIVSQIKVPIDSEDTAGTLYNKVCAAGILLFQDTLPLYASGTLKLIDQKEDKATYHPRGEPFGGQISLDWDLNQQSRFKRAFTFPPFRAFRNSPNLLGEKPKAYFVLESNLKSITLNGTNLKYRLDGIGNKDLRNEIKELIMDIKNEGIKVNLALNRMYPVHDVFMNGAILFSVSNIKPIVHWEADKTIIQPFRYENGLLEIPAICITQINSINDLFIDGSLRAIQENRDIFIPLVFSKEESLEDISQEIIRCGAEQLTFTDVYHHFDTEYEYISTSSL
tara:strand:+ start:1372 stop:2652 length:1281 start_codon:yes stop_codon:yes gene_type:complete